MTRYLILNLAVLLLVSLVVLLSDRSLITRRWAYVLGILLLMTAVFDSLIVGLGIVAYEPGNYLGVLIGRAPIEDFAYTIAALLVVPYIWKRIGGK